MKARVLVESRSPLVEEVRKLLRDSFNSGQRKALLFDLWYEAEEKVRSIPGMLEVAQYALENQVDGDQWKYKLVRSLVMRGMIRRSSGDAQSALNDFVHASNDLASLITATPAERTLRIAESRDLNDLIWRQLESMDESDGLYKFDKVVGQIANGDLRSVVFDRALRCVEEVKNSRPKGRDSDGFEKALSSCISKLLGLIDRREKDPKEHRSFVEVKSRLEAVLH